MCPAKMYVASDYCKQVENIVDCHCNCLHAHVGTYLPNIITDMYVRLFLASSVPTIQTLLD